MSVTRTAALVTLGCARNEVDSEEIAGRLAAAGWQLVDDAADADVAVVNTCGFVAQAKKDSIDTLLEAADLRADGTTRTRAVVAVGCLAERYGAELAASLPEADAVLGFDSYPELAAHLDAVLRGDRPAAHRPRDRRTLLPISPAARPGGDTPAVPPRIRLDDRSWAPVKLASGCDRRCAFCAIPAFRGAFTSRPPVEVHAEATRLAAQGVRELLLVSENSTSYGKDLADLGLLETLLPELAAIPGIFRVRLSYLQPAKLRPGLLAALTGTAGVAPYFDLSFQHASAPLLRRMRRFGGREEFLDLLDRIRAAAPTAGIRSNVIVGFPGETEEDVDVLVDFLTRARLDVVGVFGYSDEEGTEAAGMDGKHDPDVIAARVARLTSLVEELIAQRAEDRIGEEVDVLVEDVPADAGPAGAGTADAGSADPAGSADTGSADPAGSAGIPVATGRAAHQGPETDGVTHLVPGPGRGSGRDLRGRFARGELVRAVVVGSDGPDLLARPQGWE
ncbi:MAG: MiaB/RimO family radical SAM methylthiotransferase [Kineosporiaceae bacterium]